MNRAMWSAALLFITASLIGCGESGPEIATVSGHVTLDEKPLPRAQVLFVPAQGRPSIAKTDANGDYVLGYVEDRMGAIPGKCRVEITTYTPAERNAEGEMMPAAKELVPVQYNRDTTLELDVLPKTKNVANFDLESKGKLAAPPKD
jgi:hypothetical protein